MPGSTGWRVLAVPPLAFYFSLLSAFNIGWRELNVGTWITRIQKREYTLRATGWVRMISGSGSCSAFIFWPFGSLPTSAALLNQMMEIIIDTK